LNYDSKGKGMLEDHGDGKDHDLIRHTGEETHKDLMTLSKAEA